MLSDVTVFSFFSPVRAYSSASLEGFPVGFPLLGARLTAGGVNAQRVNVSGGCCECSLASVLGSGFLIWVIWSKARKTKPSRKKRSDRQNRRATRVYVIDQACRRTRMLWPLVVRRPSILSVSTLSLVLMPVELIVNAALSFFFLYPAFWGFIPSEPELDLRRTACSATSSPVMLSTSTYLGCPTSRSARRTPRSCR